MSTHSPTPPALDPFRTRSLDAALAPARARIEARCAQGPYDPSHARDVSALFAWALALVERAPSRPLVLGVSGPQGCGKSTLCEALVEAFTALGHPAVSLSLDDMYLEHAAQRQLAAAHPGNRYLEHRGYPGTHDVALALRTVDALRRGEGSRVHLPAYDKSAHQGRGDRLDATQWKTAPDALSVLLIEGWMLGFAPVGPPFDDAHFATIDAMLERYLPLWQRLDALVHLDPLDERFVLDWRVDAERARRARGAPALTDAEARDYVERFVVAYERYLPALRERPPVAGPVLRVCVARHRAFDFTR